MALAGLCAARRVYPWIVFATQFGALVIMPGDEVVKDRAENEFLHGLRPLSSSTSEVGNVIPQERLSERVAKQIGEFLSPEIAEEIVKEVQPVPQERCHHIVERVMQGIVEFGRLMPRECVHSSARLRPLWPVGAPCRRGSLLWPELHPLTFG